MSHLPIELLDRYLAGGATPDERTAVDAWLASDPAHAELLAALRDTARAIGPASAAADVSGEEATWQRLRRRTVDTTRGDTTRVDAMVDSAASRDAISIRSSRRAHDTTSQARSLFGRWWVGVAAAAACVIGVLTVIRRSAVPSGSLVARTYTTHAGQRATITLTDGSRVTLAPRSSLTVLRGFGGQERRVTLVGEGYFAVTHAADAPFLVQAGRVVTRVTGTVFDVRHYPDDRDVRVTVVSGKVVAGAIARPGVTLVAGTVGHVTDSTATAAFADDVTSDLEWVRGTLAFRDTPVPDALARLGQWYGLEFRVTDSIMTRRHMTGVFDGESRADALSTLQAVLNADMTFDSVPGHVPVVTLVRRDVRRAPAERGYRNRRDLLQTPLEVGR